MCDTIVTDNRGSTKKHISYLEMEAEVQQDKKVISNGQKVLHMSIGISLVFFGMSLMIIWLFLGSNTTQNFAVPIYRCLDNDSLIL